MFALQGQSALPCIWAFWLAINKFKRVFQVTWALQALTKQRGWSELPMYALGASSGGALVLLLALKMPLQVQTMCLTAAGNYRLSSCRPRAACLYAFTASSSEEQFGLRTFSPTPRRLTCKDSLLPAQLLQQTLCAARSYADQVSLLRTI